MVDAYVGKLKLMEPDKCEKWEWYDYNDLPIDLFLPFKNLIKDYKIFDLNE
jgi:8-oxo-dGTP diphosphatase